MGFAAMVSGAAPRHLITDHGSQFTDEAFGRWCARRRIRQRFGAVGKYGSIDVVERFIGSMKNECTRRLLVPYDRDAPRIEPRPAGTRSSNEDGAPPDNDERVNPRRQDRECRS
jgi:transposase InsO family protein